jgi:hypothetical protein
MNPAFALYPRTPTALMIGHHFSISDRCKTASACGVCWSCGGITWQVGQGLAQTWIGQRLDDDGVEPPAVTDMSAHRLPSIRKRQSLQRV